VREAFAALRALHEAERLALLGPRFMLRHPYGKRSDPISAFAFEEFTMADGLGGMLWGHPALLALTVLAGQDGVATVNDLPFHHVVDADRHGIVAVLAHKGEPSVRLAGLGAVGGGALQASAGTPRPGVRNEVSMALRSRLSEQMPVPGRARPGGDVEPESAASSDRSPDGESGGGDSDLDALLAGLDGDSNASGSADANGGDSDISMDTDLNALLKSLG
jgi:type VI secretion system protein ImpC